MAIYDGDQQKSLSVRCSPEAPVCVQELIDDLSPDCRDYLRRLFDYEDQEALVAAFQSLHFRSKVSKATGMTEQQVEMLAKEIRRKLPKYLLTCDAA
jgi:hypothetical protein